MRLASRKRNVAAWLLTDRKQVDCSLWICSLELLNKIILNSDVIPVTKRAEVEIIVRRYFHPPEWLEIIYEAGGLTRAVLRLPHDVLNYIVYENLRPVEDVGDSITDNCVTIFRVIDMDIAHVLSRGAKLPD